MTKPWRVHLANSAIVHVDLVPGNPELVAAWALDGVAAVYDLERGNAYGAATFTLPAGHAERWAYLQAFKLPHVARWSHACNLPVHVWSSAKHAVIYTGDATFTLCAGPDDRPKTLTFDVVPDAFAVDAAAQIVVALDSKGALLIGKIGGVIKTLKPGLQPTHDLRLLLQMSPRTHRLVASDGTRLVVIDGGKVSSRRDLHYACSSLALSPDGTRLMTYDADSGVLRMYDPDGLKLTHQRFAIDVLSASDERQLVGFAELPPVNAALSALALDDNGRFAFAVFGQVCGAHISHLTATETPPTVTPTPAGDTHKPTPASAIKTPSDPPKS
ncbi:MAG: hypothetical protein J5J04_01460 [Anaerolineae bacterium]|nr:MAG: hypothetical protein UZ13_01250 [Chloroflexi bacterium OLB13]MBC6956763.1 hypothetical protein [Chloroflexota bacterium]MBV6435017.1 hypothetical protein [Anaerolineae bacterium]MDL1914771.1 hypothetical protein [Anaerolineae bacterium CFX4]OQY84520.1 MAG: hypothetical protein B6D42_05145 [Anaerolineae bacterium UTCFX5]